MMDLPMAVRLADHMIRVRSSFGRQSLEVCADWCFVSSPSSRVPDDG